MSTRSTGRWRRAAVLAVLGLAALACATRQGWLTAATDATGAATARIERAGLSRIKVTPPPPGTASWGSLILRNAGPAPVRGLRFWDLGRGDLFRSLVTSDDNSFVPFTMLPGEQFACSAIAESAPPPGATATAAPPTQLSGLFSWELPADGPARQASLRRQRKATLEAAGIRLSADPQGSYLQLHFESPLPHTGARLAWEAKAEGGPAPAPQVWVSTTNRKVWARITPPRGGIAFDRPADLSVPTAGRRSFDVRIAYAGSFADEEEPEETKEQAAAPGGVQNMADRPGQPATAGILLTRLRVEREVAGPGLLGDGRPGQADFALRLHAPRAPRLDVKLIAGQ